MKISVKGFIYHKTAERFSDCFDRMELNTKNNKFAVSDGVSKSFFPGIWAQLLVDSFVNTAGKINLTDTELIKTLQNKWENIVADIVKRPNQKYFVRNLFAEGRSAAATFVGLNFLNDGKDYIWEAFAIGDSFLFFVPEQIKNLDTHFDKITFLSSKKDFEFDNFPDFFDSRDKVSKGRIKSQKGELVPGTFYLMTDALSEWFITKKQIAIDEISTWQNQTVFEERICRLREDSLQNDDVAILIINITEDDLEELNYSNVSVTNFNKFLEIEKEISEKLEIEWAEIERQLILNYEKEKEDEEKNLIQKFELKEGDEWNRLYHKHEAEKVEAKNQLLKRQEDERREQEYRLKRKHEIERIDTEKQMERNFESAKEEIRSRFDKKLEEEKSKKRTEIAKKHESQSYQFKENKSDNSKKQEDKIIVQSPIQPDEGLKNIEHKKTNSIQSNEKYRAKGKRGFWETTGQIVNYGLIKLFYLGPFDEDDEIQKRFQVHSEKGRKKNVTGDEKEKKGKSQDSNDDVSSITDKF